MTKKVSAYIKTFNISSFLLYRNNINVINTHLHFLYIFSKKCKQKIIHFLKI